MPREKLKREAPTRARVPMRGTGTEQSVVGMKVLQWNWTEGTAVSCRGRRPTGDGRSRVTKAKPFDIPKREVWEAFKKVKANRERLEWMDSRGGKYGVSVLPAAADKALKKLRRDVRRGSLQTQTDKALDELARMCKPYIRSWINYYSHFYKSALYESLRRIDFHLRKWVRRKYKRFRQRPKGAREWLARIIRTHPGLFAHWQLLHTKRLDTGSRMS